MCVRNLCNCTLDKQTKFMCEIYAPQLRPCGAKDPTDHTRKLTPFPHSLTRSLCNACGIKYGQQRCQFRAAHHAATQTLRDWLKHQQMRTQYATLMAQTFTLQHAAFTVLSDHQQGEYNADKYCYNE